MFALHHSALTQPKPRKRRDDPLPVIVFSVSSGVQQFEAEFG
jgi:hypothetical protein